MEHSFRDEVLEALAGLDPDLGTLAASAALRRLLPAPEAQAATRLHALRQRAEGKLPGAAGLLLTEKGLEQASHREVAAARARRVARHQPSRGGRGVVFDATAGIGGDSLALVEAGLRMVAADADCHTARLLAANLRRAGHGGRVLVARAEHPPVDADWLLLDPDRRPAGREEGPANSRDRRTGRPERWSPPWEVCLGLAARVRGACLKLAPATDPARLAPAVPASLPHAWQWVSLRGELKELTLWTGELAETEGDPGRREVLALDGRGGMAERRGEPVEVEALPAEAAAAVRWIAEPDPALIRSGLLGLVARDEGMAPLGPGLAYLGGTEAPRSPLLAAFEVLDEAPLDRRRVRAMLALHGIGPLTVKRRGHPDDAQTLAKRLRGSGRERGLLVVARLERGHRAYLVRRRPREAFSTTIPPASP